MGLARRLYRGETQFPLIQRRKRFYVVSILLTAVALLSMIFQGFNLGVEFKGGSIFTAPTSANVDVGATRVFVQGLGVKEAIVQTVKTSAGDTKIRIETEPLAAAEQTRVLNAIADRFQVNPLNVDTQEVGASWGKQVTNKALQGLALFLIAVIIYISLRFEPKMAIAAIVALIHDLILAAGIYSLTSIVVTPSTVIALLTVLGYSLYDTIVVFDKVEENTRGIEKQSAMTYAEAAELAVNQTFMRSINTSLIALLPVSGLLFVGALLLGAGTLKDLALALFVGLASGAYSSLFLATPLLADLKERDPKIKALHQRVIDRRTGAKGAVRLSQRSSNVLATPMAAVNTDPATATDVATVTQGPTTTRRPPGAPPRKKGSRPVSKKNKKRR